MIRQICLSCYKTVELSDDTAGKDTPCPNCGKTIAVPPKYAAGVADGGGLSAVPPPPVPPTPSPGPKPGASPMSSDPSAPPGLKAEAAPPPPPAPLPPAEGPTRGFGFTLDPKWLDWVPAACILLAFVLSLFPWTEMKLGGQSVMGQNGWGAVFASVGDPTLPQSTESQKQEWQRLEKGMMGLGDDERYKSAALKSDWLILLYLLLLLAMVLLFAAERVIRDPAAFAPTAKLTFLPSLWKWRLVALGGLAVVAFLILILQAFQGFSLQQAIHKFAWYEYYQKLVDNPPANVKRDTAIQAGQTANAYMVQQTLWLNLLLVLHAVAVVAMAARFWVAGREAKPLPRVDVKW